MYTTLISAAELAKNVNDPSWVVLDCRADLMNRDAGRALYESGHIAGSQYVDLERDLSDKTPGPNGGFRGRHPLPTREAFIEALRRLGVNHGSQVVAYDAHGGMFAARLWWMLRWAGHEAVAVLDGGLQAWQALGQALSVKAVTRPRGNAELHASLEKTIGVEEVVANLTTRQRVVVDARAPDRYRGMNETIDPVGGRIPGARNRFFKDNLQADGRFKTAEELRADFGAIIDAPEAAIMQCGSGATACHNLLALEIAGLKGAALYPGSWSEWCADTSRPMASGEPTDQW
jgi:thiosulfate/3-mercaptopyruvate sulfurtransferase